MGLSQSRECVVQGLIRGSYPLPSGGILRELQRVSGSADTWPMEVGRTVSNSRGGIALLMNGKGCM